MTSFFASLSDEDNDRESIINESGANEVAEGISRC